MHAISHRLDHLPEGLGAILGRLALALFAGFGASWDRLMDRNAARLGDPHGNDDLVWDDGEPDEPADKV